MKSSSVSNNKILSNSSKLISSIVSVLGVKSLVSISNFSPVGASTWSISWVSISDSEPDTISSWIVSFISCKAGLEIISSAGATLDSSDFNIFNYL